MGISLISYFENPSEYDEKATKKNWKPETNELMQELCCSFSYSKIFHRKTEMLVKEWITAKEIGFGKVMQPLRLSLVGALKGPHLFDIMEMIGKEATISRIEKAIATL